MITAFGLNNITITLLAFGLIILAIANAISKKEKPHSKIESAARFLSVLFTIVIFAWLITLQQYYILHFFTGQTVIENANSSMSADYFRENVLNPLPNQTWTGIARISVVPFIELKQDAQYSFETLGIYLPASHEIKLKVIAIDDMKRNLAHEFAHWYWFDKLTYAQKKEWSKLHAETKRWNSDYAKTNDMEDFAETVSFIIVWRSVVTDQEKVDFIVKNYLKPLKLEYEYNVTKSSMGDFFIVTSG